MSWGSRQHAINLELELLLSWRLASIDVVWSGFVGARFFLSLHLVMKVGQAALDLFFSIVVLIDSHLGLRDYLLELMVISVAHFSQESFDHMPALLLRMVFTSSLGT